MTVVPLLLSPAVAAFAGVATSHEQVGQAIEVITELSRLVNDFECFVLVADKSFNAILYESDAFPFHETLAPLLLATGWSEIYDPGLMLVLVTGLVERVICISSLMATNDLLLGSLEIEPQQNHLEAYPRLLETLSRSIAFYCAAVLEGCSWTPNAAVAADSLAPHAETLALECEVQLVEPPIGADAKDAFELATAIRQVRGRAEIFAHLDSMRLWGDAESDGALRLAIAAKAYQLKKAAEPETTPDKLKEFRIGAHFRDSLEGAQAAHSSPYASAMLNTCAKIVADLPQADVNPFYTAPSSGEQRIRLSDNAAAYRVHVSKAGIGVRLMYWQKPDGSIEFSNGAPKANTIIFE